MEHTVHLVCSQPDSPVSNPLFVIGLKTKEEEGGEGRMRKGRGKKRKGCSHKETKVFENLCECKCKKRRITLFFNLH